MRRRTIFTYPGPSGIDFGGGRATIDRRKVEGSIESYDHGVNSNTCWSCGISSTLYVNCRRTSAHSQYTGMSSCRWGEGVPIHSAKKSIDVHINALWVNIGHMRRICNLGRGSVRKLSASSIDFSSSSLSAVWTGEYCKESLAMTLGELHLLNSVIVEIVGMVTYIKQFRIVTLM
jgi:hypothetical protein